MLVMLEKSPIYARPVSLPSENSSMCEMLNAKFAVIFAVGAAAAAAAGRETFVER